MIRKFKFVDVAILSRTLGLLGALTSELHPYFIDHFYAVSYTRMINFKLLLTLF